MVTFFKLAGNTVANLPFIKGKVKKTKLFCISVFQIPVVADVPGVGQNLHDHIAAYGLTWTTQSAGLGYNPFLYTLDPRTYFNWKLYQVSFKFYD